MKGLTKPNLDTITRGYITNSKADQLMTEYGTIAYLGIRRIHVIPLENVNKVREVLGKMWDEERFEAVMKHGIEYNTIARRKTPVSKKEEEED